MKQLITLISTKGKTSEESAKEFMANIRKYKKVAKQVEKEMLSKK
jgi:hypothetical protein